MCLFIARALYLVMIDDAEQAIVPAAEVVRHD
jgi:hypothetical protein